VHEPQSEAENIDDKFKNTVLKECDSFIAKVHRFEFVAKNELADLQAFSNIQQ